ANGPQPDTPSSSCSMTSTWRRLTPTGSRYSLAVRSRQRARRRRYWTPHCCRRSTSMPSKCSTIPGRRRRSSSPSGERRSVGHAVIGLYRLPSHSLPGAGSCPAPGNSSRPDTCSGEPAVVLDYRHASPCIAEAEVATRAEHGQGDDGDRFDEVSVDEGVGDQG